MDCFASLIINNKAEHYFIWVQDNKDYVLTQNNKVMFWRTIDELIKYAELHNIKIEQENVPEYDLDLMKKWCLSDEADMNLDSILNMWNLLADVAYSVGSRFLGDDKTLNNLYDKIFFGNNLPTINTSGKIYKPTFSLEEVLMIKRVLIEGIVVLEKQIDSGKSAISIKGLIRGYDNN